MPFNVPGELHISIIPLTGVNSRFKIETHAKVGCLGQVRKIEVNHQSPENLIRSIMRKFRKKGIDVSCAVAEYGTPDVGQRVGLAALWVSASIVLESTY